MKLFTLIMGVALTGVVYSAPSQSELTSPQPEPIGSQEEDEETRRLDVPEVVLQLKYDKGELNRIYLTQFRKDSATWVPSVSARSNLCSDLCHAGLGGEACGSSLCSQLVPVGLQSALKIANHTDEVFGHPRYNVCPALCKNQLGAPLCSCASREADHSVDWSAVCTAFCYDGYALNGCPTCEASSTEAFPNLQSSRSLSTYEGWAAWCNVQCRQGQGGAACNCDRAPFQ
ncbi:hypothetical protein PYW07_011599 [Mythimna separata]|uniref:Uncharacterized protein n=1 Tax=Mythimna separata TaxID=271217 RepID=A0AAD8DKI3_MYTSE|nr:hypothetical protein PYW07_011599 [Mythimna separata]